MERNGPGLLAEIAFGTEANAMLNQPVMACLAGFVGGVRAVVRASTGEDRQTASLLATAKVEELEPLALPMAWRIDRLHQLDPGASPDATDAFALGRGYGEARVQVADAGMRGFLRNAVVRAFDVEIYRRGETLRLLSVARFLARAELEALMEPKAANPGVLERLARHDLLLDRSLTPSGRRLHELISDPEPIPTGWVPPWERAVPLGTDPHPGIAARSAARDAPE